MKTDFSFYLFGVSEDKHGCSNQSSPCFPALAVMDYLVSSLDPI